LDKRQILKSLVSYTQAGQRERALDMCRQAAVLFPDDAHLQSLIADLSERLGLAGPEPVLVAASAPAPAVEAEAAAPAGAEEGGDGAEARSRAIMDQAVRKRMDRQGGGSMEAVMQSSRRISDVLHEATTKHMDEDVEAMLATVRRYLDQNLYPEAMRLCQKISAQDPDNGQVKALLVEIYRRRGQ
jgi:tetratricopeptide (TPR) repeat protein